jgi:hypothetical protein
VKRSGQISFALVAAVAAGISACNRQEQQLTRVCVDEQQRTVPEEQCETQRAGGGMSAWYFLYGYQMARMGSYVGGGTFNPPSSGAAYRSGYTGRPLATPVVTRGVFGSSSSGRAISG